MPIALRDEDGTASPPSEQEDIIDITGDETDDSGLDEAIIERAASPRTVEIIEALRFPEGHEDVDSAKTLLGETVRSGDTVEVDGGKSFVRIVFITRDAAGQTFVRGTHLVRHRDVDKKIDEDGTILYSWLPLRRNELCALLNIRSGTRPTFETSFVSWHLKEVGKKREVVFTNQNFNAFSYQLDAAKYNGDKLLIEETAPLCCRWKYVQEIDARNKIICREYLHLEEHESDLGRGIADAIRVRPFGAQGDDAKSGRPRSGKASETQERSDGMQLHDTRRPQGTRSSITALGSNLNQSIATIDLTADVNDGVEISSQRLPKRGKLQVRKGQEYTIGDVCAGVGGMARGAASAGLVHKFLLDNEPEACKTLRLNFGNDVVLKMDLRDFSKKPGDYRLDVLHASFPCQAHSAANRGQNPELDASRVVTPIGSFAQILNRCKPRVVTMEQVPGILRKDKGSGKYLRQQIHALTELGYSCKWKIINMAEYGNVQARQRVIVLAACPGEKMPAWPIPTHGNGPGLKPFVTIRNALARSKPTIVGFRDRPNPRNFEPYDADQPLEGTVTGTGGQRTRNYHPSGKWDWMLYQMAQLQGFDGSHQIYGSSKGSIMKQIGNAVPPVFAEKLFTCVIRALEETDEEVAVYKPKVVELDD